MSQTQHQRPKRSHIYENNFSGIYLNFCQCHRF